jgi:hypothetical protein
MLPTRACCACTGRPDNFAAMSPTSENGRLYTCAIATTCVRVRPLESCMADSSSDERGKDRRTPTAYIYHITCQGFHRPGRHETARGLKTGRCAQCEPATYYEYTYCSMLLPCIRWWSWGTCADVPDLPAAGNMHARRCSDAVHAASGACMAWP